MATQSEGKTVSGWELMGRLKGFRFFHLDGLPASALWQKHHTDGYDLGLMTCWNHADPGLNPDCDSQAVYRSALSPFGQQAHSGKFREDSWGTYRLRLLVWQCGASDCMSGSEIRIS